MSAETVVAKTTTGGARGRRRERDDAKRDDASATEGPTRIIDARAESSFETTDDEPRPSTEEDASAADSAKTYLESTVAKALHEGMMELNATRPADPLRFLGEFLVRRADAATTTTTTTTNA